MRGYHRVDALVSKWASKLRLDAARAAVPRIANAPPPPHHLTLYEYEASPWCRLVREHLTLLDLNAHIRPCPRQTLMLEGAFSLESRFRQQAMKHLLQAHNTDDLTFPLLVDETDKSQAPVVLCQSYDILQHLWTTYGKNVKPTPPDQRRPDQIINSIKLPFSIRFLLLAAPSYLRPWPRCGIMSTPSLWSNEKAGNSIVLYQAEGCPDSRLIREMLCSLELPYLSMSAGVGTAESLPCSEDDTPILVDGAHLLVGPKESMDYLLETYWDKKGRSPSWFDEAPRPNLGRDGSFFVGAWTAVVKGSRAFVPIEAMK